MKHSLDEQLDYYARLAREKGYRQETIELGWMFACTKELVGKFGSEENALEEIIKLCEQHEDGQSFINAVGVLAGIDDK